MIGLQAFYAVSTKAAQPEVGMVAYIQVLDEVADTSSVAFMQSTSANKITTSWYWKVMPKPMTSFRP